MKHEQKHELEIRGHEEEVRRDHEAKLNLNLSVWDFIDSKDPRSDLVHNKEEIRRKIFEGAVKEIVPQIAMKNGKTPKLPQDGLDTRLRYRMNNFYRFENLPVDNQTLAIHNKMAITMQISSDKEVSGILALYHARGGLASAIADNIVCNLEYYYLGKERSRNESTHRLSDDNEVLNYQTKELPPRTESGQEKEDMKLAEEEARLEHIRMEEERNPALKIVKKLMTDLALKMMTPPPGYN